MLEPEGARMAAARAVLIVDDDPGVLQALAALLSREGIRVHSALDPEQALDILDREAVQVVISDHQMPDARLDGLGFLEVVRQVKPHVVRMLLTADGQLATVMRSIDEGEVWRYLQKPWNDAVLCATVHFAFDYAALEARDRRRVDAIRKHAEFLEDLKRRYPQLPVFGPDAEGTLLIEEAAQELGRKE
jgi:DNA-binding NtrC family response regulator